MIANGVVRFIPTKDLIFTYVYNTYFRYLKHPSYIYILYFYPLVVAVFNNTTIKVIITSYAVYVLYALGVV